MPAPARNAPRPCAPARSARFRAFALVALLALAACAAGEGNSAPIITAPTTASAGDPSTGAESTGSTSAATTGEGPTTGSGTGSGGEPTTGAPSSGTTGEPPGTTTGVQPPACDPPLTQCGVQCVDLAGDPANCGDCGVTCVIPHATAACVAGQCALGVCDDGWFDCDEELVTGCEQQLAPGQMCGLVCKPGKTETCNVFDDNCDGTCDEGPLPGCRLGVHRALSPTLGHFYTVDAAEAMSGDFKPEVLDYFHLYAAPGQGLVPFYRCLKPNGRRFYTTSSTCENGGMNEGPLGHIATDPVCGATPLFRLYAGGDHFYTVSEAERDSAVAMYGYKYEAVAGYVWPGP